MILVRLYTKAATGLMAEAGCLEFYGVRVAKSDGSTWIEFDGQGAPHPGQVKLVPAEVATPSEIKALCQALSRNEIRGETGRFEWRVE